MVKPLNLLGCKFGHLIVVKRETNDKRGGTRWLCECSCGNMIVMNATTLKHKGTKSCGCRHGLTPRQYFINRVEKNANGCWIWKLSCCKGGYGNAHFMSKQINAHRLAWLFFKGEIPEGKYVCHACDVKNCCNPDHLFLGSHSDNMQDMIKKNRQVKRTGQIQLETAGEGNRGAKLTNNDVRLIRNLYSSFLKNGKKLAIKFNVTHSCIYRIVNRETWKHV